MPFIFSIMDAITFINVSILSLFTIVFPFILLFWFCKTYKKTWKLAGIGAGIYLILTILITLIAYLISFIHPDSISFLLTAFFGLIPGILAAFAEEIVRLVSWKGFLKKYITWKNAVLFGIGWGGIQSILLGLSTLYVYIPSISFGYTIHDWAFAFEVTSIISLFFHIALTILILQSIIQKRTRFFIYALLFHLGNNSILHLIDGRILVRIIYLIFILCLSLYIIIHYEKQRKLRKLVKKYLKF